MITMLSREAARPVIRVALLVFFSLVANVGHAGEDAAPAADVGPGPTDADGEGLITAPTHPPEVSRLAIWLAGEFDNWQQVSETASANTSRPPERLHSIVTPVSLPALGSHTLYVQQYENDSPDNIVRQRIYSLRPDETAGAVAMTVYSFTTPEAVRDAHLEPSRFDSFDVDSLQRYEGCDVLWRADGDAFVGTSSDEGCVVASAEGMIVVFHSRFRLDRHLLLSHEWGTNEFEEPLWRSAESDPTRLQRCRRFRGFVAVTGDDGEEHVDPDLEMHDQGDTLEINDTRGKDTGRVLRLDSIEGSADSPSTIRLSILEPGANGLEMVGFASADPSADSIGLFIDGIRAEFSLADPSSVDLDLLASWMTGSFSNTSQAADNEAFLDISLHMAPIWPNRTDGRWFYVEQELTEHQDRPYRQRVYWLRELADDRFETQVFTLPDPTSAIGAWQQESPIADLDPADLEERQGCSIFFRRRGDAFEGSTLSSLCANTVRGATYASSEVVITPGGLVSWDRGFDGEGNQVWGATQGGHVFDRLVFQSESVAETAAETETEAGSVAETEAGSVAETEARSVTETEAESVPVPDDGSSGSGSGSGSDEGQSSRDGVKPHQHFGA